MHHHADCMHSAKKVVINKGTRLNCYIVLLLLQEKGDKSPKQVALERKEPFPFIIIEGKLNAPEELYLAAKRELLCKFQGKPFRSNSWAASLLLCFYVQLSAIFKYVFLYLQKRILKISDGQKLPSSVITFVNEIDSLPKKG